MRFKAATTAPCQVTVARASRTLDPERAFFPSISIDLESHVHHQNNARNAYLRPRVQGRLLRTLPRRMLAKYGAVRLVRGRTDPYFPVEWTEISFPSVASKGVKALRQFLCRILGLAGAISGLA